MKLERFFEKFELLGETPGAADRMRRLVLELAVRGRLMCQSPSDGTVANLAGKRVVSDEPRFQVPRNWSWIPFAEAGDQRLGKMLDQRGNRGEPRPYLRNTNVQWMRFELDDIKEIRLERDELDEYRLRAGDLLICEGGEPGRCAIWTDAEREMYFQKALHRVRPRKDILSEYLAICLRVDAQNGVLARHFTGATIKHLTGRSLAEYLIPVPPLAEQKRIVAKVDELMGLCDRLEAQQQERESRHAALAAASLTRLSEDPTPANLGFLFHTAYDVEPGELRDAVLSLAIEGKLVPQDRSDEPAQKYLERLLKGRSRATFEKRTPSEQVHASAQEDSEPFVLPEPWSWSKLGDLASLVTSGSRDWARYYSSDGAIFVRMGNLSRGTYRLRLDKLQRVTPPKDAEGDRTRLEPNDLLVSITGEVGLLGLIPHGFGEAYINQHTCLVRLPTELHTRFIAEYLRSPFAQRYFGGPQRGLKNSFRLSDVTEMPVPVPPLPEQRRIVAKVDQLMALIDELEARLVASRANGEKLLEAVIADLTEGAWAA